MTTATEVMKKFFTVLKEYADDNSYYTGKLSLDKAVRAISTSNGLVNSVEVLKKIFRNGD